MFLIYINDLPTVQTRSQIVLFANDTALSGKLGIEMAEDFEKISNWVARNSLSLNKTKTKTLNFGKAPGANHAQQFVPNSQAVTSAKYLGLEINQRLSFKEHANQLLKKTAKNVPLLYQLKKFCLLRHCLEHINLLFSQSISTANWWTVLLIKKEWKEIKVNRKCWSEIFFLKKRKIELTPKLGSKYKIQLMRELHIYELLKLLAAGLKTNTCPSRGK